MSVYRVRSEPVQWSGATPQGYNEPCYYEATEHKEAAIRWLREHDPHGDFHLAVEAINVRQTGEKPKEVFHD